MEQFRSFYTQNTPKNFEDAIEKFAIFGGEDWGKFDTSTPAIELIEDIILEDFRYIRSDITDVTTGMPLYHSLLSGIAMGDGQTHTAYKRANVSKEVGDQAISELCDIGIIRVEKSKKIFTSWAEDNGQKVSNKLYFASPFLRFWFAFVSPLFQSVRDGNFDEVRQRFENRQSEFVQLPFIQLSHEYLKINAKDDKIKEISTYWDNSIELDIYAKTEAGKTVVGSCKYINSKLKKSELTNLQEACKNAKIDADVFVLFSKNGFSNELKSLKGDNLKLYTAKSFKSLLN